MTILIQVVYFLLNDGALRLNFRGTELQYSNNAFDKKTLFAAPSKCY